MASSATALANAAPAVGRTPVAPEVAARLDQYVDRAQTAASAFRELDQEAVDRIVWAMVVAGLHGAIELAELAMEETGFGVFEDKVVKNYIASEFLYDYLKDKRSVGVIDEDPERGIQYVTEPIGVVLALTPITNQTSTVLFKSIVAAKTRNAIIFRPSAAAARCAQRAVEILQEAGERAGLPANALQVIPDPALDVSQYLFHHDGIDFIWTTGGPKAVAAANEAGKPCLSVGAGNVAVPTTAGTGSEVSPAAVLTVEGRKATLVDYSLVPDMAVVEPRLTLSMPPTLTTDTGIDALTHALEAAVSIFASPYTDAFCVQAVHEILPNLPRAFENGSDLEARTAMSNAATIARLAFSNAFVGVNHALAHAVGARFGIAHGRANAIFLPHVLRYNASLPTKFMPAPGYTAYVAREKYARIAWIIGLGGKTEEQRADRLFAKVEELLDRVEMPRSLEQAGIARAEFDAALPDLARIAFSDPSIRTNPRIPLVRELTELLEAGFSGWERRLDT
ncbi:MAG: iron-containing alcohol dehydrogenase [Thermoleophilaceae bacterium]